MKWKLKDLSYKQLVVMFLIVLGLLFFTTSFYMFSKAYFYNEDGSVDRKGEEKREKSPKIDQFIEESLNKELVSTLDIDNQISSVVFMNEGRYESHIFDYCTGQELQFDRLIKEDKKEDFFDKIKELLYLKYPNFIADVLSLFNMNNVFLIKENELVIYFYDYVTSPMVEEDLFLKVNYNEVKDYLNYYLKLDQDYTNEDGFSISGEKKVISITFDDGPSGLTKGLVDCLNQNKAHATFFMVTNKLHNYRDTVLYVHQNNHEIAYHSYAHKNFKRQSLEEINADLDYSNEMLKSITGDTFHLTRPPYGAINDEIKMGMNTSFVLWSLDTEDWRHKDVDYLINYTMENVNDGDIVLFHDIHQTSVMSMEKLLPLLYVKGYQVVSVSELAKYRDKSILEHVVYRQFK